MHQLIIPILKYLETNRKLKEIINHFNIKVLDLINCIAIINNNQQLVDYSNLNNIHLNKKIDWVNISQLQQNLNQNYTIEIINPITSTNNYIKKNLQFIQDNYLLISEYQTNGRGRNSNKSWSSKIAHDLTFSCLKQIDNNINYSLIPLLTAIAIINTSNYFGLKHYIKWPNDILDNNFEKVAGILVECITKNNKNYIIIGVGIDNNYNLNRTNLIIKFINEFELVLQEFNKSGFTNLHQTWLKYCIHINQKVFLYNQEKMILEGINTNIDNKGNLEIVTDTNEIKYFNSSQISLRLTKIL